MIIGSCVVLDQASKLLVRGNMPLGESVPLLGDVIRLTHVENRAAVMGLDLLPMGVLTLVSLVAVIGLGWWLRSLMAQPEQPAARRLSAILPWVIGGALGNLIDRGLFGGVTDMVDVDIPDINLPAFSLGPFNWSGLALERYWVFNIADSFIFVGMVLIIVLSLTGHLDEHPHPSEGADEPPQA